jgi:hypothetical protein
MATQTVSAWTHASFGTLSKKYVIAQCTAYTDATNLCCFTKKTPVWIDTTKKYTLIADADAAQDGAAAPLALYFGYKDDFVLAGTTGAPTVTSGAKYANITDDLGYAAAAVMSFIIDPILSVANVVTIAAVATGMKSRAPAAPYHAFSINAASGTLLAHTITWTIIQEK